MYLPIAFNLGVNLATWEVEPYRGPCFRRYTLCLGPAQISHRAEVPAGVAYVWDPGDSFIWVWVSNPRRLPENDPHFNAPGRTPVVGFPTEGQPSRVPAFCYEYRRMDGAYLWTNPLIIVEP